jgi:hypothetical protein
MDEIGGWDGWCLCRVGFWWGDVKEGDCLEELGIDERIILKWILEKLNRITWTGLI